MLKIKCVATLQCILNMRDHMLLILCEITINEAKKRSACPKDDLWKE